MSPTRLAARLAALFAALLVLDPAAPAGMSTCPQGKPKPEDERVLDAIGQWLRLYRKRALVPSDPAVGTKSILRKAELSHLLQRGDGGPQRMARGRRVPTAMTELQALAGAAGRLGTAAAAQRLLELAAVGLDKRQRYTEEMAPNAVRGVGEAALARMAGDAARDHLAAIAGGAPVGARAPGLALQTAAVRVLGQRGDGAHAALLERLVDHDDLPLRMAAIESLGRCGAPGSVARLAEALERETAPNVVIALVWAVRDLHRRSPDKVDIAHLRRAAVAAGKHLARVEHRPTGQALIDFLERFRYRDSVPALIGLLQRFADDASLARSGKLTAGVRDRAHEVLKSLTGAVLPADAPGAWLEFWKREGDKLKVHVVADKDKPKEGSTRGGFFGIPVAGRRVVFVIDVSGSMEQPMPQAGSGGTQAGGRAAGRVLKITKAKEELLAAVEALPPEHQFNVIFYANDVARWRNGLVPASRRNKKALATELQARRARGGTNLYGGLKTGLELKSLVYGERYETQCDEVFILSDGMPTVGDVTDPAQILRAVAETNRYSGVRINAIYLGSKSDERRPGNAGRSEREGGEFLKELAEQNGGRFVWPVGS